MGFHKRIQKEYSFYCAEFVKTVLEKAEIKTELPEIVKPEDFKKIQGIQEIYEGMLREYKY